MRNEQNSIHCQVDCWNIILGKKYNFLKIRTRFLSSPWTPTLPAALRMIVTSR